MPLPGLCIYIADDNGVHKNGGEVGRYLTLIKGKCSHPYKLLTASKVSPGGPASNMCSRLHFCSIFPWQRADRYCSDQQFQ